MTLKNYGLALWLSSEVLIGRGTLAGEIDMRVVDRNRPLYLPVAPQGLRETGRQPLNPDPPIASYAFTGRDDQQDPHPPYIYLLGRDIGRDQASQTRNWVGDGVPDTWLRANLRNLGFYMGHGGGYYLTDFILQTKGHPFRRWDTVVNSSYPLLQVISKGQRINRADGSITGFNPPQNIPIDLFIGDDGLLAGRNIPLELMVISLDGAYRMDVSLYNLWDNKID
mgnify:FL=1